MRDEREVGSSKHVGTSTSSTVERSWQRSSVGRIGEGLQRRKKGKKKARQKKRRGGERRKGKRDAKEELTFDGELVRVGQDEGLSILRPLEVPSVLL